MYWTNFIFVFSFNFCNTFKEIRDCCLQIVNEILVLFFPQIGIFDEKRCVFNYDSSSIERIHSLHLYINI